MYRHHRVMYEFDQGTYAVPKVDESMPQSILFRNRCDSLCRRSANIP